LRESTRGSRTVAETTGTDDLAFGAFFAMDRVDPCSAKAHIEDWILSIHTQVSSAVRHLVSKQPVEHFVQPLTQPTIARHRRRAAPERFVARDL
jgi:hypothetical protein